MMPLDKMTERQQIAFLTRECDAASPSDVLAYQDDKHAIKSLHGLEKRKFDEDISLELAASTPRVEQVTHTAPIYYSSEEEHASHKRLVKATISNKKNTSSDNDDEAWQGETTAARSGKITHKKKAVVSHHCTEKKTVKRQKKKNEAICSVCEEGGEGLVECAGPFCLRSFHEQCIPRSLKNDNNTVDSSWQCRDCESNMGQCFFCKKKGEPGKDLIKCKVHQCGKYYHYDCVSKLKFAKLITSKAQRFNCPLHYCAICGISGDGKQSVHCFRCPTAYHVMCMPSTIKFLSDKSKESRKTGIILCPNHTKEKSSPPAESTSSLFDAVEAEINSEEYRERFSPQYVNKSSPMSPPSPPSHHHPTYLSSSDEDRVHSPYANQQGAVRRFRNVRPSAEGGFEKWDKHEHVEGSIDNMKSREFQGNASELDACKMLAGEIGQKERCNCSGSDSTTCSAFHKRLDRMEISLLEEIEKERDIAFQDLRQPPKKRQRKMDQVVSLESKFKDEVDGYKNELLSTYQRMWRECTAEYEQKAKRLREECDSVLVRTEEELMCRLREWVRCYSYATLPPPSSPPSPVLPSLPVLLAPPHSYLYSSPHPPTLPNISSLDLPARLHPLDSTSLPPLSPTSPGSSPLQYSPPSPPTPSSYRLSPLHHHHHFSPTKMTFNSNPACMGT